MDSLTIIYSMKIRLSNLFIINSLKCGFNEFIAGTII